MEIKDNWYKILVGNKCCRGGNYEYDLPKLKDDGSYEAGKWSDEIPKHELDMCKNGYHLTDVPTNWIKDGCTTYEAEFKEYIILDDDKICCTSIRLLRPVKKLSLCYYDLDRENNTGNNTGNCNTGDCNTGDCNTGDCNTGDCNTGDNNTGNSNTGNRNTGYSNTGDNNTGNSNTGNRNTGYSNTGYSNTGDNNTGHSNTGYSNTGYSNTGYSNTGNNNTGNNNTGHSNTGNSNTGDNNTGNNNTGYSNTGHNNTGDWNRSNSNSGFLNTTEPKVRIFNKETNIPRAEIRFPEWFYKVEFIERIEYSADEKLNNKDKRTIGGYPKIIDVKTAWKTAFDNASKEEIEQTIALPNFDYSVFEEISGITKEMIEVKLKSR